MLAVVSSHAPVGIEGEVITVEVDLRRGIPGIDLVGLPDNAVRESRERVRVAIRNSGFKFPPERILVNLAPAGIRKFGASFDLPIALAVLGASGQVPLNNGSSLMILGELNLRGQVRSINGVLSAVAAGSKLGIKHFFVPRENLVEAQCLNRSFVWGISSLQEAAERLIDLSRGRTPSLPQRFSPVSEEPVEQIFGDLSDLRGHEKLKRALEIAAAGRHNLFLFGPPGSGKTMAARRLATLQPALPKEEALTVTRIYSIAGLLPSDSGLIRHRPFRAPHHTASNEGLVGGGRWARPGEISLAHEGILFLDEAPEFRQTLLQSLRGPSEEGLVSIVRVGSRVQYPTSFQLVLACNPCPCGNLGRGDRACLCSTQEVRNYWKRLGNALLDRMDIRVPVKPVSVKEMMGERGETSRQVRVRVERAAARQRNRFRKNDYSWNSRIPPGMIMEFCRLDAVSNHALAGAVEKLFLSSRACHSILRIARTIADLACEQDIGKEHVLEAVQHRRFGEDDSFWNYG
jgi:magnesium chelatase family protein